MKKILFAIMMATISQQAAAECSTLLMVTVNGGPAMSSRVTIRLYAQGELLDSTGRSSLKTSLSCGESYQMEADFEDQPTRSRPFKALDNSSIVIDFQK